jgi:dinuclear metal center YbgI/SA1388 family protein
MAQVRHAIEAIERVAPKRFAFQFDKVGLQVGDPYAELRRAVVSLDRSLGAVAFARDVDAQLLVAHHPLIFEPLNSVLQTSHIGRTVLELARNNIAFTAAHTNWDSARGGINDALAGLLGLQEVAEFGSAAQVARLKLVVMCPSSAVQAIIDAASGAGAGLIGEYSRCAFTSPGRGTFVGSESSHPTVGEKGRIEELDETRLEMVLPESKAKAVARAVVRSHPYEEAAYDFFVLAPIDEQPAGRIGLLAQPLSLRQLVGFANERLDTASWAWGDPERPVRKLAVVGGAADSEWRQARDAGADAFLTGEVKQHVALEAAEEGFAVIASGHYATEHPGCAVLRERLAGEMPDIDWKLFVPEAGFAGRPITA